MEPTEPPRGTKRPLPASAAGDEDYDGAGRAAPGERKPRFPKGKKDKNRDPGAADAGGSREGGAAAEDIDSLMNPELAAVRRARRRHCREGEDTQGAAVDVRGFEVRYENLLTWSKRGKKNILMKMGILWNMQETMKLRMSGWIVLKLTQSMLKRFKRKKMKKRSSRIFLLMILER